MNKAANRRGGLGRTLLAAWCVLALAAGCGEKKPQPDQFLEQWRDTAERSRAPAPKPRQRVIETDPAEGAGRQAERDGKPLPAMKVTLRMYDADIGVVLQTLARAADRNILVNSAVKGKINLNIKEMPWDQVFLSVLRNNGLDYEWDGDILRVISAQEVEGRIEMLRKRRELLLSQQDMGRTEMITRVVKVDYASPEDLKKSLENLFELEALSGQGGKGQGGKGGKGQGEEGASNGRVEIDPYSNSLILKASPEDVARMIRLVDQLDRPRVQIRLEARIVEATKDVARSLGVQWGGRYVSPSTGHGNNWTIFPGGTYDASADKVVSSFSEVGVFGAGNAVNFPSPLLTTEAGAKAGIAFGKIAGNMLEAQLSALENENKVNILSSPSITTMDNQKAVTENGERVPYVATNPEGKLEVKFEDAVLKLEITPNVIDGDTMKMTILVQKDEVDTTRTVQGNPYIIKKRTETRLVCQNHETIVISGLSRTRDGKAVEGVPWLKDLPGLGAAFRTDTKRRLNEEVLIFITPHILDVASDGPEGAAESPSQAGVPGDRPDAGSSERPAARLDGRPGRTESESATGTKE